jgi:hypothetical protein
LSFVQGPSTNQYSRTCCWQIFEAWFCPNI